MGDVLVRDKRRKNTLKELFFSSSYGTWTSLNMCIKTPTWRSSYRNATKRDKQKKTGNTPKAW